MHIMFAMPTLGPGGSERVAGILAARWARRGHAVTMLTLEAGDATPHYPLAGQVDLVRIGRPRYGGGPAMTTRGALPGLWRLRRAIRRRRPDVVLSFITKMNVLVLIATVGMRVPVLVSERVHPGAHRFGRLWERLRAALYPRAAGVAVQTEDIGAWFRDRLGIAPAVLPNPFDPGPFASPPPVEEARRRCRDLAAKRGEPVTAERPNWLVGLGRLDRQKGYDLLLQAFAAVARRCPDWEVWIFGEGPARADLVALREHLGLTDRARFPGVVENPAVALTAADLFVHPARYEGTPNAVIEAMACGRCVIAADSPGGTAGLLGHGGRGVLVPVEDTTALGAAILELARDPGRRAALAARAPEALDGLDVETVADRWMAWLTEIAGPGRTRG